MSTALSPRTERLLQRVIDLGERLFVLLLFSVFAARIWHGIALRPYNLLALFNEGLVVVLILIRRDASIFSTSPFAWAVALAGTALPLFAWPGSQPLLPSFVGTALMVAGLSTSIWSKLTLRRSFGVAAANRGLVLAGPYRFIRHPMYAGYTLLYIGFLLNNPLPWNLAVYAAVLILIVARMLAEDAVLAGDPDHAAFVARVRYRVLPGVF